MAQIFVDPTITSPRRDEFGAVCKIREDTCSGIGLRLEGLSQAPCLDQMMSIWPKIAIHHLCTEFSVI